jgi:hypothetical protein
MEINKSLIKVCDVILRDIETNEVLSTLHNITVDESVLQEWLPDGSVYIKGNRIFIKNNDIK